MRHPNNVCQICTHTQYNVFARKSPGLPYKLETSIIRREKYRIMKQNSTSIPTLEIGKPKEKKCFYNLKATRILEVK